MVGAEDRLLLVYQPQWDWDTRLLGDPKGTDQLPLAGLSPRWAWGSVRAGTVRPGAQARGALGGPGLAEGQPC